MAITMWWLFSWHGRQHIVTYYPAVLIPLVIPGEFPSQRPVTRSFVFFDLRLTKPLSKHSWGWWFEKPSRPLWRQFNKEKRFSRLQLIWAALSYKPYFTIHVYWPIQRNEMNIFIFSMCNIASLKLYFLSNDAHMRPTASLNYDSIP